MPHNMCLCLYHENFINAVNCIQKVIPEFSKYGDDDDSKEFYDTFFCSEMTMECFSNSCKACKDSFIDSIQGVCSAESHLKVVWYEWKEKGGRQHKEKQCGSLEELAKHISDIALEFFEHCYVKRSQQKAYTKCLHTTENDHQLAVIQLDFAENYKCIAQDEIQNDHWNQAQLSIFTVTVWIAGLITSYALVSDDLDHSKDTIVPYVDKILESLPQNIKKVHFWSDGPTSQFKNKFVAKSIGLLQKRHKMTIHWSYFATSHGKGPVDGVGGALKREIWTKVKTRGSMVRNAAEFFDAHNKNSKVKLILMNTSDIEDRAKAMNLKDEWKSAKDVRGIMKFHHLQTVDEKVVGFRTTDESSN